MARTHLAMSQPTDELEIIESRAWPVPWKPSSPERLPAECADLRVAGAECTVDPDRVRGQPDSTSESPGHAAAEMPPPLLLASRGLRLVAGEVLVADPAAAAGVGDEAEAVVHRRGDRHLGSGRDHPDYVGVAIRRGADVQTGGGVLASDHFERRGGHRIGLGRMPRPAWPSASPWAWPWSVTLWPWAWNYWPAGAPALAPASESSRAPPAGRLAGAGYAIWVWSPGQVAAATPTPRRPTTSIGTATRAMRTATGGRSALRGRD